MILETKRTILRNFKQDDLEDLFEYAKVEDLGKNAGWKPHKTIEDSKEVLNMFLNDKLTFAIVYKDNNKVIGSISFFDDKLRNNINCKRLGYVLNKNYWGKGLMQEIVKEFLNYAFNKLNLELISVSHFTDNIRSKNVILKCGFQFEGTFRNYIKIYNGEIKNGCFYSQTKEEFNKK